MHRHRFLTTSLIVWALGSLLVGPGCSCIAIVPPARFADTHDPAAGKAKDASAPTESASPNDASPEPLSDPADASPEPGEPTPEQAPEQAPEPTPEQASEPTPEEPVTEPPPSDPCVPSPCDPNATCKEENGQAVCTCKPGYTGDGVRCEDIAVSLDGLRWELPCTRDWDEYPTVCFCPGKTRATTQLKGARSLLYELTLRFRGVVETKAYTGGTHDGKHWQVGGTPANDNWNTYRLTVSNPPQTYYLNRGQSERYYCVGIDYTQTIRAYGGATITLYADSIEGREIKNLDANQKPIVVPGVKPAPAPYDGQFAQMDVVKIQRAAP